MCGLTSPYSGCDCVKLPRSSYMGLHPQRLQCAGKAVWGAGLRCNQLRVVSFKFYLTQGINSKVLKSQLPHKIVNSLCDDFFDDFKSIILWGG